MNEESLTYEEFMKLKEEYPLFFWNKTPPRRIMFEELYTQAWIGISNRATASYIITNEDI